MDRRALAGSEKVLGEDRPETLVRVWCLAKLYIKMIVPHFSSCSSAVYLNGVGTERKVEDHAQRMCAAIGVGCCQSVS